MAWTCSGRTNYHLIGNLSRKGLITSPRVQAAMEQVDRAHYCPMPNHADEDSPQYIGHGATISAPHMHAAAAESLLPFLHADARVLDVGSGSGYLTAVLAELVAQEAALATAASTTTKDISLNTVGDVRVRGTVVGLEHIRALRDLGEANLGKSARGKAMLDDGRVRFVVGDGRKGWLEDAGGELGWDVIHVGAAAVEVHRELVEQLRSPGRIFIPVGPADGNQQIWIVDKDARGKVSTEKTIGVRYVPLTDAPP